MDVLVDLTPLDTTSRLRGIGHYVASLGAALAALTPSERQGLTLGGLTDLHGDHALGPLTWPGSERPRYPEVDQMRYIWRRRTHLPLTLRRLAPRLFHSTQNLGTPRVTGVPRVLTCHDMIRLVMHEQYLGNPSRAYLEAYRINEVARYATARRVIAVSRFTADDLMKVLAVPASRIDVVHHGVDTERFHPPVDDAERALHAAQRKALGVDQRPYILFVGATDPRKQADVLVRAFAEARLQDTELLFAGWLTPWQQQAIESVRSEFPGTSIRFLGFVPDESMNALLGGALALAFPSTYEGFGMPVLEAMAAGCPVITTAATSLGEVAGEAALLLPVVDVPHMVDALTRICRDEHLRADLRTAGLARARTFTWHATALGHIDSYARALRG